MELILLLLVALRLLTRRCPIARKKIPLMVRLLPTTVVTALPKVR